MADAAAIPFGYLALALAASWPLARDFATYTIGDVSYDERHAIWVLWYTAQALAGLVSWPDTTHLLWPHGISVLVDGVGPLNGILALPFWPWGAAAAFNGAALAGLALSGWCLYLLARGIGLSRGPAFVAGMLFLLWPIHLMGLTGHLEKMFVGMLPLTLLGGLRAFDPQRGRAWLVAPGLGLLGALLQNGNQFTFAALGVGLVGVQTWWAAPSAEKSTRLRRMVIAGALSLAICLPLLLAIIRVMRDPTLQVSLGEAAFYYSPDVLNLVLPAPHQWWAGWLYPDPKHVHDWVWASTLPGLNPTPIWYGTGVETAVTIPLTAIALCAWGWRARTGRAWILFGAAFVALCLGPRLRIDGVATPVRLPFVVAKEDARPRRDADTGALHVHRRGRLRAGRRRRALRAGTAPSVEGDGDRHGHSGARRRRVLAARLDAIGAAASAGVLPTARRRSLRRRRPRPPDGREQHLRLGLHVLPDGPSPADCLVDLSRAHLRYPNAGLEGMWVPEAPGGPALRAPIRALGYRYVVVHRYPWIFLDGTVADGRIGEPWATPNPPDSERLIREAFQGEAPVHVDDLVTVWAP